MNNLHGNTKSSIFTPLNYISSSIRVLAPLIVGNSEKILQFTIISSCYQPNTVLRSTYKPALECITALKNHYSDIDKDKFGVIGVMYHTYMQKHRGQITRIGNDVQLGITESGHNGESCLEASIRGAQEEALITPKNELVHLRSYTYNKKGKTCNLGTFTYMIKGDNYIPLFRNELIIDSSNDNKTIKGQIFICGYKDDIIPIIQNFQKTIDGVHYNTDREGCLINNPRSHDPIQKLVFIPFSRIDEFM